MKTQPKPKTEIMYPSTLEELEAMRVLHQKELAPEMLAIHAINPGSLKNSPSRLVMFTQHLPQHLVVSGSEAPAILSGLEYELGKYTFATRMPHDGVIQRVIKRYTRHLGDDSINGTPEQTVIYQKDVNGELDVFSIKEWKSFHQYFGFKNKMTPDYTRIQERAHLPKGMKFADTPANLEGELYTYSVNLNTAKMDVPGVAEDGMILSRSGLKKLRVKIYETREISFGRNSFPLNSFGTDEEYKIMPDIGEYVRHDGYLIGVRPYRDFSSIVNMGPKELRTVDHIFDEKRYTRETSVDKYSVDHNYAVVSGKVVDIQVIKSPDGNRSLPPTMTKQLDKYVTGLQAYYKELLKFETQKTIEIKKMDPKAKLRMTPELQEYFVKARAITGHSSSKGGSNLSLQYRRSQLDEYTVYFTIEHELEPREGWKLTASYGD